MTIQSLSIDTLKISPLNVRKSKRQHIAALADDIAAHGLIHNLVGYKNGKGYHIVAGARRLDAIRLLQKNGRLAEDFTVPVSIRSKEEAIELSLAENQSRDDMHPADAIEAYCKLASQGLASDDIAGRFGVTVSHVNRILSLAGLHPSIRAALAEDELGMEAAKAYTLTADLEQQLQLYSSLGNNAHMVRRALTGDKVTTDSGYFEIVPLEDYLEAGGTLTQDLFSDGVTGYADDMQLLWSLLRQQMDAIRDEHLADGWVLVEICDHQPDNYYGLNHMRPQGRRDLTKEETAQLADLEQQAEAIRQGGEEAQSWNHEGLAVINKMVQQIEQSRVFYTAEQKAEAKVLIFIGPNGSLTIQPIALRKPVKKNAADGATKPARYSQSLCQSVQRIKLLAIREAVATNPTVALDMLIASLIESRLAYGINAPLAIRCNAKPVQVDAALMAKASITDIEEQADSQCAAFDRSQLLTEIGGMDSDEKMQLLASLCATLIDGDSRLPDDIIETLGIDMGQKWQPDNAFFNRMTKAALHDLLREECGTEAANNCRKLSKADLVQEVAHRLEGRSWLPPLLANAPSNN